MAVLSVIRSSRSLVTPCLPTPSGILELSFIDKVPVLRCYTRTLHVYKHGPEAPKVIREALSKALVPYYPLAGRLKESGENQLLEVECSGEGVWFVEALADSTLHALDYFDSANYLSIPDDQLLPDQVPKREAMEPLVQMQVTQFACGGFVIGLIFCHTVCDGLGSAQFLNAVGELARGLEHLSTPPVWHRNFFPSSPQQANIVTVLPNLPPPMPDYRLQHLNIDISVDEINQVKQEFRESTGQACSTFEIVAANFWTLRTRAISFKPNTQVRLLFFANCRQLLDPPLPKGFYGNCFFPITITAPCELLIKQASIIEVIKLIQEAKTKLPIEFAKFKNGDYLRNGKDPFTPPLDYTTLFISEWGRLGFNQVDFGWGPPVHMAPIPGSAIIPVGIMGSLPLPNKGIRLMTCCVEENHHRPFLHLMTKLV